LVVTANSSARTVKALNPSKNGGGTLGTTNSFGRSSPYPSTLLAVGPFFLLLGPLGLCPIPFLRCPFRDIVDNGRHFDDEGVVVCTIATPDVTRARIAAATSAEEMTS
jgi:hypothetical protein